jgi:hypothetical protein
MMVPREISAAKKRQLVYALTRVVVVPPAKLGANFSILLMNFGLKTRREAPLLQEH